MTNSYSYSNNKIIVYRFLVCLCCENATYSCRATMVPIHASFGLATFMLACTTCVTGLTHDAVNTLRYIIINLLINVKKKRRCTIGLD